MPPKAPGWVLGPVHPAVEDQTGAVGMKVVSVAGHDSASAVAAIPGFGKNKLYVCLGTNANMGVETDRPDISDAAYRYGFKNSLQGEPGAFLVYQDFPAFLLVNAVKKEWAQQGNTYSYDQVEQMAEEARFRPFLCQPKGSKIPESPRKYHRGFDRAFGGNRPDSSRHSRRVDPLLV